MNSAREMEGACKQLNDILKAVTEANALAERAETQTVGYKERMNQPLERRVKLEARFLSSPRRNVLAIAEEQKNLIADEAANRDSGEGMDVHKTILSDAIEKEKGICC